MKKLKTVRYFVEIESDKATRDLLCSVIYGVLHSFERNGGLQRYIFNEESVQSQPQSVGDTRVMRMPSFKESAGAIATKFPHGLTDGNGNLTGMVYYGAKAMYDYINCELSGRST